MEKIIKSYSEDFKPVTLFLDDLEDIVGIFKEVSNKVEIIADEYKLDDSDEFSKLRKEMVDSLIIRSLEPWISLSIEYVDSNIYLDQDTALSRGILEKVKEILKRRRRRFSWLSRDNLVGVFFSLFSLVLFFLIYKGISQKSFLYILLGIFDLLFGSLFIRFCVKLGRNIIYLKRHAESKSFWKRRKDEIIIAVISAIVGAVVTIIGIKIFHLL